MLGHSRRMLSPSCLPWVDVGHTFVLPREKESTLVFDSPRNEQLSIRLSSLIDSCSAVRIYLLEYIWNKIVSYKAKPTIIFRFFKLGSISIDHAFHFYFSLGLVWGRK